MHPLKNVPGLSDAQRNLLDYPCPAKGCSISQVVVACLSMLAIAGEVAHLFYPEQTPVLIVNFAHWTINVLILISVLGTFLMVYDISIIDDLFSNLGEKFRRGEFDSVQGMHNAVWKHWFSPQTRWLRTMRVMENFLDLALLIVMVASGWYVRATIYFICMVVVLGCHTILSSIKIKYLKSIPDADIRKLMDTTLVR
jgi:hypothetical protein